MAPPIWTAIIVFLYEFCVCVFDKIISFGNAVSCAAVKFKSYDGCDAALTAPTILPAVEAAHDANIIFFWWCIEMCCNSSKNCS